MLWVPLYYYVVNSSIYKIKNGCLGRKPWGDLSAREVYNEVVVQGTRLPLDKRTMPRNLFQLINVGLNNNKDYLDLQEIRDMLLITRVSLYQIYYQDSEFC